MYRHDSIKAGEDGVEIKSTRKKGGAVDTLGRVNNGCVCSSMKWTQRRSRLVTVVR